MTIQADFRSKIRNTHHHSTTAANMHALISFHSVGLLNIVYYACAALGPDKFAWSEFEQLRWPEGWRAGRPE